jgi:hypothetical protein
LTEKELLNEIEQELRTVRGMPTEKKISLWRAKKALEDSLTHKEIVGPNGSTDNSNFETKSLHELQMLQKELNYQKRQISKAIRTKVRSAKPDQSK